MKNKFNKNSMTLLDDSELKKLYQAVMTKK